MGKKEPSQPLEHGEYIVEKIVRSRTSNGKKEVLVKWYGYTSKHNTWEPEENIRDIPETIIVESVIPEPTKSKQVKRSRESTDDGFNEDNDLFDQENDLDLVNDSIDNKENIKLDSKLFFYWFLIHNLFAFI